MIANSNHEYVVKKLGPRLPLRSLKTGLEPLGSSGFHHPADDIDLKVVP